MPRSGGHSGATSPGLATTRTAPARRGSSCVRSACATPTPATRAKPATCRSATSARRPGPRGSRYPRGMSSPRSRTTSSRMKRRTPSSTACAPRSRCRPIPTCHEGFADIVALFLHFSYPGVVEQAIRESRGAIARGSLLSDVAREFGYARSRIGAGAALRSAIDVEGVVAFDSDVPPGTDAGPVKYDPALEPHQLGSVLVSAVFEAFVTVVRRKGERLLRIAGLDSRLVGQAQLGEELVRALAQEASDVATRFLDICIRAIDYCPPVDLEMGEYLRALVTADAELVHDDKWGYREALMRSFRRRQIFPDHVEFMTEDAVQWQRPAAQLRIPGLAFG